MKTPIIVLLLSLSFLLLLPIQTVPVRGVMESGPTNWTPFGPASRNLLITFHSDFQTMFNAFAAGEIDVTDWPVTPDLINTFGCDASAKPDFFCTQQEGEFGIFQLDRNHAAPFLGRAQQIARVTGAAGISSFTDAAGACAAGQNRFIISLQNSETGNSPIQDPLNRLTVTHATAGSPSATVQGNTGNNVYTTSCLLAGPYKISTSGYGAAPSGTGVGFDTVPAPAQTGRDVTVTFRANYNSASSQTMSADGRQIGKALAHLLDKPSFVNGPQIQGLGAHDDTETSSAQGLIPCTDAPANTNCAPVAARLPQSTIQADSSSHSWYAGTVVSAYNLAGDALGASNYWWGVNGGGVAASLGYSGLSDIRGACDHFVAAGFVTVGGDCAAIAAILQGTATPACATTTPYSCPRLNNNGQQVIVYGRTHPPRRAFAQIVSDGINALFGTPNGDNAHGIQCTVNYGFLSPGAGCTPAYYTITQVFDIVFRATDPITGQLTTASIRDWGIYSGGYSLGSTPEQVWSLYHGGRFTASVCGGPFEDFPNNYQLYCNPQQDGDSDSAEFAPDLTISNNYFGRAALLQYEDVNTIPVYSLQQQFVALNGWNFQPGTQSSLVKQLGHGWQTGYWSLFNMNQRLGADRNPVPASNPIYQAGGGNPDLIRRGFSQDVHKLSLFQGLTVWDFEVMLQIYDSMLAVNPRTGGSGSQIIDWSTRTHTKSFNANEVSCVPQAVGPDVCVTGTTTQTWRLRQDLRFHNGAAVTGDDVCFSILTFRDVPSANLKPSVSTVATCTNPDPLTVIVKLQLESPFYELNVGGVPIIPHSVWAGPCSWPVGQPKPSISVLSASLCADPAFDPMANGLMIGHGDYVCKEITGAPGFPVGQVGGSCSQNADGSRGTQDIVLGGRVSLEAAPNFHRGPIAISDVGAINNAHRISWADKNNDGFVSIFDSADLGLVFGKSRTDAQKANCSTDANPAECSRIAYWDNAFGGNNGPYGTTPNVVDIGEMAQIAFVFDSGATKPAAPSSLAALSTADPYLLGNPIFILWGSCIFNAEPFKVTVSVERTSIHTYLFVDPNNPDSYIWFVVIKIHPKTTITIQPGSAVCI